PILHPTRAETALPVIKDHALDQALGQSSFSAHRRAHNLRPHITVTADPPARKADCGLFRSTVAISLPYNFSASPSNADLRTCQIFHEGCVTRYSTQPPPGRSEERRVGKECSSRCASNHQKNKQTK